MEVDLAWGVEIEGLVYWVWKKGKGLELESGVGKGFTKKKKKKKKNREVRRKVKREGGRKKFEGRLSSFECRGFHEEMSTLL